MKRQIIEPVAPSGLDIILTYACPSCHTPLPVAAPIHPIKIKCAMCSLEFPILPADPTTLQYLRLILADGAAIINADFM